MDPQLQGQLTQHYIELQTQVYSAQFVLVYKALYKGYDAAVKVLFLPPESDQRQLDKEWQMLKQLQHANIIQLYDDFWAEANGRWFLCLVLEWCAKDFYKDLQQRKVNQYPYTEIELWGYLRQAVEALAYMQQQGAAHRDIKPQNLFLANTGLKIGDFGSAKFTESETNRLTLTGTPYFLSPILKAGLLSQKAQCDHNPFKSDAFSLGVTFLLLVTLEPMPLAVASSGNVSDAIRLLLDNTSYSDQLKGCVNWMCAFNEEDRCDFLALHSYLNPPQPQEYQAEPQPYESPMTSPFISFKPEPQIAIIEDQPGPVEPQQSYQVVEEVKAEEGAEFLDVEGETPDGNPNKPLPPDFLLISVCEHSVNSCRTCYKETTPESLGWVNYWAKAGRKDVFCSLECLYRAHPQKSPGFLEQLKNYFWNKFS